MIIEGMSYLTDPNKQFVTKGGAPNVGGFVRVYLANTDDLAITYCDFNGTRNPQDILLDNNGRAVIIANASKVYRVEVYDRIGGLQWTVQPAYCIGGESGVTPVAVGSDYLIAAGTTPFDDSENYATLEQSAKGGDSIWLDDNGRLRAKAGVYQINYNARVYIASQAEDVLEDALRELSVEMDSYWSVNYKDVLADLSYEHKIDISNSFLMKLNNEQWIKFRINGVGGIVRYTLGYFSIFKVSE